MDPFPTRTSGPYAAPGSGTFGITLDDLRQGVTTELEKVASALMGYPAVSLDALPHAWASGEQLSLASAAVAPAAGVRNAFPVAVYGVGAAATGAVSLQVLIPGVYQILIVNSVDAPGGGNVRYAVTTGVLGSEGDVSGRPGAGFAGDTVATSIDTALTDIVLWTPAGELLLYSPCMVGITVARDPAHADDTSPADSYVLGVALRRSRNYA